MCFVHENNICERFLDFTDVSTDSTFYGSIQDDYLIDFRISIKLVGQTCDGATVMNGHVSSLRSCIISESCLHTLLCSYFSSTCTAEIVC